jgi:hypothetical protein
VAVPAPDFNHGCIPARHSDQQKEPMKTACERRDMVSKLLTEMDCPESTWLPGEQEQRR